MTHHSALSISAVLVLAALLHAKVASAQEKFLRFEVAPLFSAYHAPAGFKSVTDQFELGGRFGWNWFPHLSLEGEYASTLRQPAIRTQDEGGYFSQALFGVKSGTRWKNWGLFAKFRPGFVSYSNVITSANFADTSKPLTFGRLTDAAYDAGGGTEFFISRHWLFRFDADDLIVHQGGRRFNFNGQEITFLPSTTNNFESEVSVAFRF